jgi:hypothetical protein
MTRTVSAPVDAAILSMSRLHLKGKQVFKYTAGCFRSSSTLLPILTMPQQVESVEKRNKRGKGMTMLVFVANSNVEYLEAIDAEVARMRETMKVKLSFS